MEEQKVKSYVFFVGPSGGLWHANKDIKFQNKTTKHYHGMTKSELSD